MSDVTTTAATAATLRPQPHRPHRRPEKEKGKNDSKKGEEGAGGGGVRTRALALRFRRRLCGVPDIVRRGEKGGEGGKGDFFKTKPLTFFVTWRSRIEHNKPIMSPTQPLEITT